MNRAAADRVQADVFHQNRDMQSRVRQVRRGQAGGRVRNDAFSALVAAVLLVLAPSAGEAAPSEHYLYDVTAAATVLVESCGEPKALLQSLHDWAAAYGLAISASRADKYIDDERERHGKWPDRALHCRLEHNYVVDAVGRKPTPPPPPKVAEAAPTANSNANANTNAKVNAAE